MSAKDKLIAVFNCIKQAYIDCGVLDKNKDISDFVDTLQNGMFMEMPPNQQKSILDWYDQAYLGRGQLIKGLMFKNLVPPGFSSEMRIAIIMYLLEINIPKENKEQLRHELSNLIKNC